MSRAAVVLNPTKVDDDEAVPCCYGCRQNPARRSIDRLLRATQTSAVVAGEHLGRDADPETFQLVRLPVRPREQLV
jgi:hypothetical protein